MRSFCTCLAAAVLFASLSVLAPGCSSGTTELEKPSEPPKAQDPMKDMPGFAESQAKLKAAGKAK
jgi:hypothetical protein